MEFGLKSGYPERREYGWEVGSRRWAGDDYGWQTEESFQKVAEERDRGFLSGTVDTVKQYVADPIQRGIASIPGAEPVLNFIGGVATWIDKNAVDPYRQAAQDPAQIGTPQALLGTVLTLPETGSTAGKEAARAVGLDVRVGESIGGAAGEALQGGVVGKLSQAAKAISKLPPGATGLQPAMVGSLPMTPVPTPKIQGGSVFMSTTSPEWTSPKAGLGSAKSKQFAPAVERWEKRESLWQKTLKALKDSGASPRRIAKFEAVRKGDLSTFDYDPENLYDFYEGLKESPYQKQIRQRGEFKTIKEARPLDPFDLAKKAQQHHILAKAETKPFVETLMSLMADGIANKDDFVNFFVWSEKYDLIPGNVRKNLLHMGEITHTVAKKDPMALHNILKEAGLEYGSKTGPEIIKRYGLDKVTSADELMQAYDRYLREIAIPSRDITYKVHDWWYDKTVKTLKGKELKEFKNTYSKLGDPRKSP